jgi:hypothetical protein
LVLCKTKKDLKEQRFADIPDIQRNVTLLRGISENNFKDCFGQWNHRFTLQGEYSEGDSSR